MDDAQIAVGEERLQEAGIVERLAVEQLEPDRANVFRVLREDSPGEKGFRIAVAQVALALIEVVVAVDAEWYKVDSDVEELGEADD